MVRAAGMGLGLASTHCSAAPQHLAIVVADAGHAAALPCWPHPRHDDHGFERGSHPVTAAITYGAGRSVLLALLNGGVRPPPAALRAAVCAAGRGSPHEDPGEAAWLVEQLVVAGAEVGACPAVQCTSGHGCSCRAASRYVASVLVLLGGHGGHVLLWPPVC